MSKIPLTEFVSRLRSIVEDIEFAELNCDQAAAYDDFFESLRPKISQRAEWLSKLSPFDLDFWSGAELATRQRAETESKRDTRSLSWFSHEPPSDSEKQAFNRDYAARFDSVFCESVAACTALVSDDRTSTRIADFLDVLPDLRKALNAFERIDLEEKRPYVLNVASEGSGKVETPMLKRARGRQPIPLDEEDHAIQKMIEDGCDLKWRDILKARGLRPTADNQKKVERARDRIRHERKLKATADK